MKQFAVIMIIYLVAILLAKLLTVGLFLVFLYLKKIIQNMDEERWNSYFRVISNKGLLFRLLTIYVVTLFVISIFAHFIFYGLGYRYSINLSLLLIVIGSIYILLKYKINRNTIMAKLNQIRGEKVL